MRVPGVFLNPYNWSYQKTRFLTIGSWFSTFAGLNLGFFPDAYMYEGCRLDNLPKVFSRWWFQIFFYVHPYLGKMSNLTIIFQMGWNTFWNPLVFDHGFGAVKGLGMICWTVQNSKPLQILLGDDIWSNYSGRKHEFFTPKGGLVRDCFLISGDIPSWWNIIIWSDNKCLCYKVGPYQL